MATDAVLLIFGYLLLVAPPDFVSNSITNLGLAEVSYANKLRQIRLFNDVFNIQLATRSAAPPVPFFVESRWFDDYYSGDIYAAFEEAQKHQVSKLILLFHFLYGLTF